MNRMDEFQNMKAELENMPQQLDGCIKRVYKKSRRRGIKISISALSIIAGFFLLFTVGVNSSNTIAYACGKIPLLKELALAVASSPSLAAAVENEYVQPIEQEISKDDITIRIEYVIVDQKQVNIFYTMKSDRYHALSCTPRIRDENNEALEGYSIFSSHQEEELKRFTVDFIEGNVPECLTLSLRVHDNGEWTKTEMVLNDDAENKENVLEEGNQEPEIISTFDFLLSFDPYFTEQGTILTLNQKFDIDGQQLILATVGIYPSHLELCFDDVDTNTAWLKSFDYYIENERGERFEGIGNGISATGSIDSPMMEGHRLESSFFSKSKELTLHIKGVTWLDKEYEHATLDLVKGTIDFLPEGAALIPPQKHNGDWIVRFKGSNEESSCDIISCNYTDGAGKRQSFLQWSTSTGGYYDEAKEEYITDDNAFITEYILHDYPYSTVSFDLIYTRKETLDNEIVLPLKEE